jgi:hypothetical protein
VMFCRLCSFAPLMMMLFIGRPLRRESIYK